MLTDPVIRANQATGAYRRARFASFDQPAPEEEFQEAPEPAPAVAESEPEPPVETEVAVAPEPAPPETPAEVETVVPEFKLPTAEEIEQIHQQAWKEGYDTGYEEGSARGRLESAELHQLLQSIDGALGGLDEQVGAAILELSLEVARLVIRDTLTTRPELISTLIREVLLQTPLQRAQIHVNPADVELVRTYLGEQLAEAEHRLVEDDSIERGGCKIETEGAHIDATLATRWQRITESLSNDHPWQEKRHDRASG
ncbi:MAG: flagellar assembly protein FliH [Betaproteobacteria bacterium]|nr:flagellar assembly protein FliH [Betaproteobacteria bacterium]